MTSVAEKPKSPGQGSSPSRSPGPPSSPNSNNGHNKGPPQRSSSASTATSGLDTIQDFLCELSMKPHMHLVKISIFSLNLVIVRLTKIMNRADKNWAHF